LQHSDFQGISKEFLAFKIIGNAVLSIQDCKHFPKEGILDQQREIPFDKTTTQRAFWRRYAKLWLSGTVNVAQIC
jgi:hypothetical protein